MVLSVILNHEMRTHDKKYRTWNTDKLGNKHDDTVIKNSMLALEKTFFWPTINHKNVKTKCIIRMGRKSRFNSCRSWCHSTTQHDFLLDQIIMCMYLCDGDLISRIFDDPVEYAPSIPCRLIVHVHKWRVSWISELVVVLNKISDDW